MLYQSDFVDYLELFQLQRCFVPVSPDDQGRLIIRIEGPMIQAMFFEIFILTIVNELYFRRLETSAVIEEGERRFTGQSATAERSCSYTKSEWIRRSLFPISARAAATPLRLAGTRVIRTLVEAAPPRARYQQCLSGQKSASRNRHHGAWVPQTL